MENKNIDFVARHYRKGRFSVEAGWRRLGIARAFGLRRFRAAAAIAATVILSATAAIIYKEYSYDRASEAAAVETAVGPMAEVKIIDFEKSPLPEVVKKIESIYSVKVDNLPEQADSLVLSLHYEGNAAELVTIINEILGTELTVSAK